MYIIITLSFISPSGNRKQILSRPGLEPGFIVRDAYFTIDLNDFSPKIMIIRVFCYLINIILWEIFQKEYAYSIFYLFYNIYELSNEFYSWINKIWT